MNKLTLNEQKSFLQEMLPKAVNIEWCAESKTWEVKVGEMVEEGAAYEVFNHYKYLGENKFRRVFKIEVEI